MDIEKFINEDLGVNIKSYIKDDIVYLNSEDVCRGLGFIQEAREKTFTSTSGGKQYHQTEAVRWSRINQYLKDYRDLVLLIEGKVDNSMIPSQNKQNCINMDL